MGQRECHNKFTFYQPRPILLVIVSFFSSMFLIAPSVSKTYVTSVDLFQFTFGIFVILISFDFGEMYKDGEQGLHAVKFQDD